MLEKQIFEQYDRILNIQGNLYQILEKMECNDSKDTSIKDVKNLPTGILNQGVVILTILDDIEEITLKLKEILGA